MDKDEEIYRFFQAGFLLATMLHDDLLQLADDMFFV